MGLFLAISGVIGKSQKEVISSLASYAKSVQGGIQQKEFTKDDNNRCVIEECGGNTTVLYPYGYVEWDMSSMFISNELNAPVFSFHIHDGDFWMYLLYSNGKLVDQFNPIPDYWDETISAEEINSWKGDVSIISKYIAGLNPKDIENYLVRWNQDSQQKTKAYPDDEFMHEDWQLTDFMRRLNLSYPLDEHGNSKKNTYELWTSQLPLRIAKTSKKRPWWKLW